MNTTMKRTIGLAALAAVVLVLAWYLALFSPQARDLSKAHKDHTAAEQKITQLRSQIVQLNALKSEIPADKAALSALDAAVPSTPQLDSTLIELHDVATSSGATLSSVNPSSPATSGTSAPQQSSGSPSITLSMSAAGSYSQLMSFMSGLAAMPRTVVVNSLNIAGTGSQLTAQITAKIFYTGA